MKTKLQAQLVAVLSMIVFCWLITTFFEVNESNPAPGFYWTTRSLLIVSGCISYAVYSFLRPKEEDGDSKGGQQ